MNLYVGNLSFEVTESDLQGAFANFGSVVSARVVSDMGSGRSKGFGFVEMASKEDGQKAIAGLDGTDLRGRTLTVNEARPRESRDSGSPKRGG